MDVEHDGAIPLSELADIARTVQRAVDQIARSLNNREDGGRPPESLRQLSALEAVGIQEGSAVLEIESPHDTAQFPIDFGKADAGVQAVELFVVSLDALSRGEHPPPEIGTKAPQTIRRFARAVSSHEQVRVESTVGDSRTDATLRPVELPFEHLPVAESHDEARPTRLVGRLYEANLREGHYRIEDEAGRTRYLTSSEAIDDQSLVRSHFGEVVAISAIPIESERGRDLFEMQSVHRVTPPPVADYYDWSIEDAAARVEPIDALAELAVPDLDEEEADAFWRAAKS